MSSRGQRPSGGRAVFAIAGVPREGRFRFARQPLPRSPPAASYSARRADVVSRGNPAQRLSSARKPVSRDAVEGEAIGRAGSPKVSPLGERLFQLLRGRSVGRAADQATEDDAPIEPI